MKVRVNYIFYIFINSYKTFGVWDQRFDRWVLCVVITELSIIIDVINHLSLPRWLTDPSHLLRNLRPEGLWKQFLVRRSPVELLPLMLYRIFAFIYLFNSRRKPQWRCLSLCATLIIIQKVARSQVTSWWRLTRNANLAHCWQQLRVKVEVFHYVHEGIELVAKLREIKNNSLSTIWLHL